LCPVGVRLSACSPLAASRSRARVYSLPLPAAEICRGSTIRWRRPWTPSPGRSNIWRVGRPRFVDHCHSGAAWSGGSNLTHETNRRQAAAASRFKSCGHLLLPCAVAARQRRTLLSWFDVARGTAFFRVNRSQFSEFRRGLFGFRRIFCLYAFCTHYFLSYSRFCQFWFLEVEIFQSTFGGEPIKNRRALKFRVKGQFETRTDRQRHGKWIRLSQNQNCQAISIIQGRKTEQWWRVMQAERPLSRAADSSMCWTGIGAAVFDCRGGSHGRGRRMASASRRSMSRQNHIT